MTAVQWINIFERELRVGVDEAATTLVMGLIREFSYRLEEEHHIDRRKVIEAFNHGQDIYDAVQRAFPDSLQAGGYRAIFDIQFPRVLEIIDAGSAHEQDPSSPQLLELTA